MASPPPASLRDLYAAPPPTWSFTVPDTPPAKANASAASSSTPAWSTRPAPNPLFDLAAFPDDDAGLDVRKLAQDLALAALLQYATSAIVMPWEVGKTLLQVQWVPRELGDVRPDAVLTTDVVEDEDELSDESFNDDSYFADPSKLDPHTPTRPPRQADERGYVIRQSVLEEGTLPEYIIPVGCVDGTWEMIKRLSRFRPEGWTALWKGLLTTAIQNGLSAYLQPTIYSALQSIFSPVSPHIPVSVLFIPVASHVLTGLILSPLDLVRTRLIVQSSVPRFRTYSGPFDAFRQILTHEGGLRGVYLHPHLLFPTLFDCTLRALVPLTLPALVASYLRFGAAAPITPETSPTLWQVADTVGTALGSLVVLPFETVRRRLQVQVRGTARPLKACVELRPAPYNGMVDAFWHVLTEERSDLPLKPRRRRRRSVGGKGKGKEVREEDEEDGEGWLRHSGLGQLYRGLTMQMTASAIVFVLALLSRGDESDGWVEL